MAKFTAMCNKVRLSVARNGIFQPLAARMGVTRMFSSAEGNGGNIIDPVDMTPPIPEYVEKSGETIDLKRSRLLYQSRKRGMLENGLLLSNFAGRHLDSLTPDQLTTYDKLINRPTNDWEIYYWMTGVKETPDEYQSDIMDLLKEFVKNEDREVRIRQPDLS